MLIILITIRSMSQITKPNAIIYSTLFELGLLCGLYYMRTVIPTVGAGIAAVHRSTLNGTISSPFRYRIFADFIVGLFSNPSNDIQIITTSSLLHALGFAVMFVSLYHWLQCFASRSMALVGVFLLAIYIQLMLYVWANSLCNVFEVIFLCLALIVIYKAPARWELGYGVLIVIATLNRETAILLPIIFALVYISRVKSGWFWVRLLTFFGLWAFVFIALRLILGIAPEGITVSEIWALNTGGGWWTEEAIIKNAFFIPVWIGALGGLRRSPRFVQMAFIAVLPYLVLFLIYGVWNEVRLLLPVLVLVLPPFLLYIREANPRRRSAT